ncbi:hypothetical protein J8281_12220 [Aquimarina sp. U1-2]|uniref:hypothetical protein n=1 Tax=Aquimarina sp. U1-2 TaxID=2823141 RepID=UPI001AEC7CED|nr:hypothetical protein [Aquimarina sp. U1-2]MBP2832953.1 hypothetical protein [Aquimarina sp. U1-2]
MKRFFRVVLLIFTAMICFHCSSDDNMQPNPDPDSNPDTNPNPNKTTTYNADVKVIIDAQCVRCHTDPPVEGAPFPLRNYSETIVGVNRDLVLRMVSNSMNNVMPPSGRLPQETIDIILDWEADGFLEK